MFGFILLALYLLYSGSYFSRFSKMLMGISTKSRAFWAAAYIVAAVAGAMLMVFFPVVYLLCGFIISATLITILSRYKLFDVLIGASFTRQVQFLILNFLFWPATFMAGLFGYIGYKTLLTSVNKAIIDSIPTDEAEKPEDSEEP